MNVCLYIVKYVRISDDYKISALPKNEMRVLNEPLVGLAGMSACKPIGHAIPLRPRHLSGSVLNGFARVQVRDAVCRFAPAPGAPLGRVANGGAICETPDYAEGGFTTTARHPADQPAADADMRSASATAWSIRGTPVRPSPEPRAIVPAPPAA